MRASSPFGFSLLFQFAKANPRSAAPRTAALVRGAFGRRRFCCGKNEREGTPQRRRDSEARARNHPTARQADHAPRDRARFSGQEKGSEAEGRACSYIRISDPFSYRLPQHLRTQKRRFSRELEGGFCLQKPSLERPPPLERFTFMRYNKPILIRMKGVYSYEI